MTDEVEQSAKMFEEHMNACEVCRTGMDVCQIGGKLLQLLYQSLIDPTTLDHYKKKPN